jgi:hypothetical protein
MKRVLRKGINRPQPKDGEIVFLCGHKLNPAHWYQIPMPVTFFFDGKSVSGQWFCVCQGCHDATEGGAMTDIFDRVTQVETFRGKEPLEWVDSLPDSHKS